MGREVTADRICFGVFLCSWDGELSLTELGRGEPEVLVTSRDKSTRTQETMYLMQWIKVGSSPQLVLDDRESNTNIISGEMEENKGLEILSAWAG